MKWKDIPNDTAYFYGKECVLKGSEKEAYNIRANVVYTHIMDYQTMMNSVKVGPFLPWEFIK